MPGVDVNPDGSLVISSGTNLYLGRIVNGAWQQDSSIGTPKTLTEVCTGYGMADYFVATTDGVYAIRNGALGEKIDTAIGQAYDVLRLDTAEYTNSMAQLEGESYKLIDSLWVPLGGPGNSGVIDLHNATVSQGMAQTKDAMYGVMAPGFHAWNNQDYVQGMQVPEPATMLWVAAGGVSLVTRRHRAK